MGVSPKQLPTLVSHTEVDKLDQAKYSIVMEQNFSAILDYLSWIVEVGFASSHVSLSELENFITQVDSLCGSFDEQKFFFQVQQQRQLRLLFAKLAERLISDKIPASELFEAGDLLIRTLLAVESNIGSLTIQIQDVIEFIVDLLNQNPPIFMGVKFDLMRIVCELRIQDISSQQILAIRKPGEVFLTSSTLLTFQTEIEKVLATYAELYQEIVARSNHDPIYIVVHVMSQFAGLDSLQVIAIQNKIMLENLLGLNHLQAAKLLQGIESLLLKMASAQLKLFFVPGLINQFVTDDLAKSATIKRILVAMTNFAMYADLTELAIIDRDIERIDSFINSTIPTSQPEELSRFRYAVHMALQLNSRNHPMAGYFASKVEKLYDPYLSGDLGIAAQKLYADFNNHWASKSRRDDQMFY